MGLPFFSRWRRRSIQKRRGFIPPVSGKMPVRRYPVEQRMPIMNGRLEDHRPLTPEEIRRRRKRRIVVSVAVGGGILAFVLGIIGLRDSRRPINQPIQPPIVRPENGGREKGVEVIRPRNGRTAIEESPKERANRLEKERVEKERLEKEREKQKPPKTELELLEEKYPFYSKEESLKGIKKYYEFAKEQGFMGFNFIPDYDFNNPYWKPKSADDKSYEQLMKSEKLFSGSLFEVERTNPDGSKQSTYMLYANGLFHYPSPDGRGGKQGTILGIYLDPDVYGQYKARVIGVYDPR